MSDFSKVVEFLSGCDANGNTYDDSELKDMVANTSAYVEDETKAIPNDNDVVPFPLEKVSYITVDSNEDELEIASFAREAFERNRIMNNKAIREKELAVRKKRAKAKKKSVLRKAINNLLK